MTDILKVRTTVSYFINEEIDLDEWEDYGYDSKDDMRSASLEADFIEYWDIVNNAKEKPLIKVEEIT